MATGDNPTRDFSRPRGSCNAWRQGRCRFGENCKFKHDLGEKGIMKNDRKIVPRANENENGWDTTMRAGPSNRPAAGQTRDSNYTFSNFPVKLVACKDWQSGRCTRGESCRFSHNDEVNDKLEQTQTRSKRPDQRQNTEKDREDQEIANMVAEMRTRAELQGKAEQERRRHAEREEASREASRIQQIELQARRVQEATVVEQYLVFDSSLVTCTAGLDISSVIPGFDLCCVTIKNLPRDTRPEEIKDIFIQQGLKRSDFFLSNHQIKFDLLEATVLVNAEYGPLIAIGLEGIPFRDHPLSFSLSDNANANSMDLYKRNDPFLLVTWKAPSDTLIATYLTMEQAQCWAAKLNGTQWHGHRLKAVMNDPPQGAAAQRFFHPASIKIMNLPPNGYINTELYGVTGSVNLRLLKSPRYDLEESFRSTRERLRGMHGVRMDTYEVLANGDQESGEVKIKVLFENWENAQEAHASIGTIRGCTTSPNLRSWIPPKPLRYTIRIPKQQYEAERRQWDALSQKTPGSGAYVQCKIGNRGDVVFIDVLGQDKEVLGPLKVRVESMVSGEKLGPGFWHQSMASRSAKGFFNRIYDETRVYVQNDFKTRSLKVYGEPDKVVEARRMIKAEIDRLAQTETTRTLLDRGSVKFFVEEGLGKLNELLGEENVKLNLASRPCTITVKGGEEAVHHLQRLLEEARATVFHDSVLAKTAERYTCPICMDDASHPETLVCGHTYCGGCIKHFLISAADTKVFPLVCMGKDATCNTPIAIPFIRRFLPASVFQLLIETVFISYLDEHPQEFRYCTTPDCKQIYRRKAKKAVLQCPSCFSSICPACGEEAHENMTCEERRVLKNPALQEKLNEDFARASGFKKCPQCNIWIEKTEGCNHMSCKCGAHICWRCMAISDRNGAFDGQSIYRHMNAAHGNIFDNPLGNDDHPVQQHRIPQPRAQADQQPHQNLFGMNLVQEVERVEEQRRRMQERENERLAAEAQRQQQAEIERLRIAQNARVFEDLMRVQRERDERTRRAERRWCIIM